MPLLELAVQDAAGARVAADAGAARVELCAALAGTGGLTPSLGTIEAAVTVGVPVHVLVRPRAGGFVYDADEVALTERDIRAALGAGASGVVVGALSADGRLDTEALARYVDAASGAPVTFHRALDVMLAAGVGPADALASLSGVTRVLTSGGAANCRQGVTTLAELVAAGSSIEIMAGGGVRVADIPALIAVGVDAVHLSARRAVDGPPAGPGGGPSGWDVTDAALARSAAEALAE